MDGWRFSMKYRSMEEWKAQKQRELIEFYSTLGDEVLQNYINKSTVSITVEHKLLTGHDVPTGEPGDWLCGYNPNAVMSVYNVEIREVPKMQEVKLYMPSADYHFGKGKPENVRTKLKNCFDYLTDKDGDKYKSEWKKV